MSDGAIGRAGEPGHSPRMAAGPLALDVEKAAATLCRWLRDSVLATQRRRGAVLGVSGGVDSAVCAALCARALGPEKVLGLLMPERDSADDSLRLGRLLTDHFEIATIVEPMGPALAAAGSYERQAEAIREVFPEYGDGYKCKVTTPPRLDSDRLTFVHLVIQSPAGEVQSARLPPAAYLKLIAATNYKQRLRKTTEYYHADRLTYAVVGTPNRLEYELGFFVKHGDGAADIKPIAHLYKTQVYALAEYLGVPEEVRRQPPTTDTFSLPQTQEEFYFAVPYETLDLCLYGRSHGLAAAELAPLAGLTAEQVERVYRDIDAKRRVARHLHAAPLTLDLAGS
jgi:NAD+ synthase